MDMQTVNWQDVFDKFLVYLAALPARAAELQGGAARAEAASVRKDFLTIPEIAARWRIARPTVYNRLKDAGVRVLDFAPKGGRGRKIVPLGAILEIERQQLKRL
ncbi:MAG TPA: hypothetical protein VKO18_17835 [Terriglobia bacterium]|nr:hypothetical protein [Terriglobia bacterium]